MKHLAGNAICYTAAFSAPCIIVPGIMQSLQVMMPCGPWLLGSLFLVCALRLDGSTSPWFILCDTETFYFLNHMYSANKIALENIALFIVL